MSGSDLIIKKNYEHRININTQINTNDHNIHYNLFIVYYINCMLNENYMEWLYNQINIVKNYSEKIYIIATIQKEKESDFKCYVIKLFPSVMIECFYSEEFEYRGIMKVWKLGQLYKNSNDIILYFHSKGMTHYQTFYQTLNDDYNIVLKNFDLINEIFMIFPKINKIGLFCGGIGWIWYNFWFARGSYINTVERPIKTTRRHYYEDWLSRVVEKGDEISFEDKERPITYYKNTLDECYGLYTDNGKFFNIGSYFDSEKDCIFNM